MPSDIKILTFGSALLRSPDEVAAAVHEIYRWYRDGLRVLVVAGDIDPAQGAQPRLAAPCGIPEPDAFTPLLLGERGATTILATALDRAGIPVRIADRVAVADDVRMAALGMDESTAPRATTPACDEPDSPSPTRVILLGLGTVGFGVYQRLLALPREFTVLAALVRDRGRQVAQGVPAGILHVTEQPLLELAADLIVDALPGAEPSHRLVRHFLERGMDVVSANKVLIADHHEALSRAGQRTGARLRYAAAVGGAAPMLEAVRGTIRRGPISGIEGVLNGSCNVVLERCARGDSLADAVAGAQEAGFAESDPSEDLSGRDAERKLRILAANAFGRRSTRVDVMPLTAAIGHAARDAARNGRCLRQVSSAVRDGDGWTGRVAFEVLDSGHPFASLPGEWNALRITQSAATVTVRGRGAGRWPTTEAVMADMFEARRRRSSVRPP
jgi:homoserine dehydrogenase